MFRAERKCAPTERGTARVCAGTALFCSTTDELASSVNRQGARPDRMTDPREQPTGSDRAMNARGPRADDPVRSRADRKQSGERQSSSRHPSKLGDPNVVCVLTPMANTLSSSGRSGKPGVRALVAALGDSNAPSVTSSSLAAELPRTVGDAPPPRAARLLASRTFRADEMDSALVQWLASLRVGRVVRLAPANACVVRPLELPELERSRGGGGVGAGAGDRQALADALPLLAEAEAPQAPWWRRCAGVLASSHEAASPLAIVCSWSGDADAEPEESVADVSYMPPVVALAGLGRVLASELPSGQPTLLAQQAPESAVVSIVAWGPNRTVARSARDRASSAVFADTASDTADDASISGVVRETALAAGIAEQSIRRMGAFHIATAEARTASGDANDLAAAHDSPDRANLPSWITDWGLALGALSVVASDDPAERTLASLRRVEPIPYVPPIARTMRWLARPGVAARLIAASIGLAVLVPMASAWGRLRVMEARAKDAKLEDRLAEAEQRAGFYDMLFERRWPMSKLLADVAGSCPPGVELESIELAQGESVSIRGRAEKADLVARFRESLTKTRVFSQLATPSVESGEGVRFQITAKILGNGAIYEGAWADDYTQQSLGKKLFGETWVEPEIATADDGRDDDRRSSRRRTTDDDNGPTRAGASRSSASSSSSAASFVPPPPLTDADIAKMDRTTAMKEFGQRKAAAAKATDPDVKRRLNEEADKAKARMQQAAQTSGSGGGGS